MNKIKKILSHLIVPAVTIILISQLVFMTREITWDMILETIGNIAWWQTSLLIVFGFIAIVPSILNDFILARWQEYKISTIELIQRSWQINVFNINAGFIGFVSILLRRVFFFDQEKNNRIKTFVQMYVIGLLGLLIASTLVGIVCFFDIVKGFEDDIIWFVAIVILALIIFSILLIPRINFWQGMRGSVLKKLAGVSLLSFVSQAILFITIGLTVGIDIDIPDMGVIFTIASVIALITMTPGTWGSFDVAVLIIMSDIAVGQDKVVVWLILYRLVYNIIPLLSALILFGYRLSKQINETYRGVPHYVAGVITHKLTTVALYMTGILLVLSGTMPTVVTRVVVLNSFRSWPITHALANQLPNILLGFLLLISARGVANCVKRAYDSTIALLMFIIIYALFEYRHIIPMVFVSILLILFITTKRTLYREQFIYAWEEQVIDGIIWGALIISYLLLGVMNAPLIKRHFNHFYETSMIPSIHWWIIGVVIISVVSLFSLILSKYLRARQKKLGELFDEKRLQNLLTVGDTHYTNLAFLGDKRFYYFQINQEDKVGLQFRIVNNKAMVMGDPFGDVGYFSEAMQEFVEEADKLNFIPVFYEVSEKIAMLAHEFGYDFFKLGEEAQVILAEFSTAGKKMQNVRSVINQSTRAGFSFKVLQPPFNDNVMKQLSDISREWLNGREEKGYSLGFFDENYIQRYPIAILSKDDQIEAYATLVTSHTENQMAVDLMRFTKKAPSGVMDVLFVNTINYAKSLGLETLNLGMSPLANVGLHRQSFGREKLANLVYQFGSRVYSFEGLHHYKNKFTKNWVPMYIAYSRKSWIIMVMIGLLKIDNKGVNHAPEVKFLYDKDNEITKGEEI